MDEEDIVSLIRNALKGHDGKWDIQQGLEVQNALEVEIEQKLRHYESVKFRVQEVKVELDEAAAKMLQSNRDMAVGIHVVKNETDEKIARNVQNQRVLESEMESKKLKIQEMALMMKNFGSLGPVVDKYIQGEIDGEKLYDYIMKAKTSDMSMLNVAMSNDLLTQDEAIEKLNEILGDTKFIQLGEKPQLPNKGKNVIQEKKQEDIEEIPLGDGDYI